MMLELVWSFLEMFIDMLLPLLVFIFTFLQLELCFLWNLIHCQLLAWNNLLLSVMVLQISLKVEINRSQLILLHPKRMIPSFFLLMKEHEIQKRVLVEVNHLILQNRLLLNKVDLLKLLLAVCIEDEESFLSIFIQLSPQYHHFNFQFIFK